MEPEVATRYADQPEVLKTFKDYQKKFTEIFPDSVPRKMQKLNSPGNSSRNKIAFDNAINSSLL